MSSGPRTATMPFASRAQEDFNVGLSNEVTCQDGFKDETSMCPEYMQFSTIVCINLSSFEQADEGLLKDHDISYQLHQMADDPSHSFIKRDNAL